MSDPKDAPKGMWDWDEITPHRAKNLMLPGLWKRGVGDKYDLVATPDALVVENSEDHSLVVSIPTGDLRKGYEHIRSVLPWHDGEVRR